MRELKRYRTPVRVLITYNSNSNRLHHTIHIVNFDRLKQHCHYMNTKYGRDYKMSRYRESLKLNSAVIILMDCYRIIEEISLKSRSIRFSTLKSYIKEPRTLEYKATHTFLIGIGDICKL